MRGTREVLVAPFTPSFTVPPDLGVIAPSYDTVAESLTQWKLRYVESDMRALFGEPPLVALVNLLSTYTGATSVFFDAALVPDVEYRLDLFYFGKTAVFAGPRRARADRRTAELAPLADIDAPLVRGNRRGGDYTRAGRADFVVTGGLATIEKLIWHRLLTPVGTLDWRPGYGSRLRLKEMRPAELRSEETRLRALVEEVPGVVSASVSILFDDGHAFIAVRAQTDLGLLETSRPAGATA